jgi:hypothetical protein
MQAQDKRADFFLVAGRVRFDQFVNALRILCRPVEMPFHHAIHGQLHEHGRLFFAKNGDGRIKPELLEMFPDQMQAEAVQCRNGRGLDQGEFALEARRGDGIGVCAFSFQTLGDAPAHFGGGCFGKRDNQHFSHADGALAMQDIMKATLDERACFAGTRAGHYEHIAGGLNGLALIVRDGHSSDGASRER